MILTASNNASTTLAGPIIPGATTLNVQSGAGALFPAPGANQYFTLTLNDAATGLRNEICWCTNVTGDTLTVIRAQEGTSAQSWIANDLASNFWTAGSMAVMAQQGQLQAFTSNQAPDVGSVNNVVAALTPTPGSLAAIAGAPIIITGIRASNTGGVTLNLNGFGAQPIINPDDTDMSPGQLTVNSIMMVAWSAVQSMFVLLSISTASRPPAPFVHVVGGFTAPIPNGMTTATMTVVGGGGAGGGCDGTHNAGGGGAGGVCVAYLTSLVPGQNITGTVGAGGTAASGATGGSGGNTTAQVNGAGTVYTANGGAGGIGASTSPAGGSGGSASGGTLNFTGSEGADGDETNINSPAGMGGPGYLGAGAGRGGNPAGGNGAAPGAGGGGCYGVTGAGGSGFDGIVIIVWGP